MKQFTKQFSHLSPTQIHRLIGGRRHRNAVAKEAALDRQAKLAGLISKMGVARDEAGRPLRSHGLFQGQIKELAKQLGVSRITALARLAGAHPTGKLGGSDAGSGQGGKKTDGTGRKMRVWRMGFSQIIASQSFAADFPASMEAISLKQIVKYIPFALRYKGAAG